MFCVNYFFSPGWEINSTQQGLVQPCRIKIGDVKKKNPLFDLDVARAVSILAVLMIVYKGSFLNDRGDSLFV